MTNFHNFGLKQKQIELQGCITPLRKLQMSVIYVCAFELQHFSINNKTWKESWNLVIMTPGDTPTGRTHILEVNVFHNILKQD